MNTPNLIVRIKTKDLQSNKNYITSLKKILDFLEINYFTEITTDNTQKNDGNLDGIYKTISFTITNKEYDNLPF